MIQLANRDVFLRRLTELLGDDGLLTDAATCHVYGRDASHIILGRPLAVALPKSTTQIPTIIKACGEAGVPLVCRGTGTGLSGGAVPVEGALVLGTSRLSWLDPIDPVGCRVTVGPGVLNDRVTAHGSAHGLHFAPDPSSQSAATIGGNVAENAGGPHCLRHGVTLQHLQGMQWCDVKGRALVSGRRLACERGFDLTSLLCGSEGTLGVVTGADLALIPDSPRIVTLLAFFPKLDEATSSVVHLLGAKLLPVAVEIIDQAMLVAVEEAFAFGFPTDVEAAMICEFAGLPEEVTEDADRAETMLKECGANQVRRAEDLVERLELWKCRKKAFGAVGRLAPRYVTMDVVVPLGELSGLVRQIQVIKQDYQVEVATAFHAGDGNLHPGVHYDDRDPELTRRAHVAADEIIQDALARGGSCTGEHGVGLEKLHAVPWQIDSEYARLQQKVKTLFDPENLLNPGKMLPPENSVFAALKSSPKEISFAWESLTVSAPADTGVGEIQARALERGLWIPTGVFSTEKRSGLGGCGTVADLVNHLLPGPALLAGGSTRDSLLELWAQTGDDRPFRCGAPVFKNVVGYDLTHALCGSGGCFARPNAATFQLRPVPEMAMALRFTADFQHNDFTAGLEKLLHYLVRRPSGTAGANCLLDESTQMVTVVTAGRHRDWDLSQLAATLVDIWPGLSLEQEHLVEFARAAEILNEELLPSWALTADHWTSHAALPGTESHTPPGLGQLIWQAKPRLWWSPSQTGAGEGWFSDTSFAAAGITPLPEPGPLVPRDLLRGLKHIFDPQNALGGPAWLIGGEDVS